MYAASFIKEMSLHNDVMQRPFPKIRFVYSILPHSVTTVFLFIRYRCQCLGNLLYALFQRSRYHRFRKERNVGIYGQFHL